jgi:hypothetical protein
MRRIPSFMVLCAMAAGAAHAGPPFVTDDPQPVDLHHWEVYGFSALTHVQGDTSGTLSGVEINYGAAPNLQLHVIAPLAFDEPQGGAALAGIGDLELGAKVRLVDRDKDDWWPQIGVFPLVEVPTGNARRGLGGGTAREYLPVWLQWDVGKWTSYGGGGLWLNPGVGNRNYWFAGWLLQYQLTDNLALGGEVFHQTVDSFTGKDTTGFNLGGIYDITGHYHLLFSAGRGLQNASTANEISYYFAIQWTGP